MMLIVQQLNDIDDIINSKKFKHLHLNTNEKIIWEHENYDDNSMFLYPKISTTTQCSITKSFCSNLKT